MSPQDQATKSILKYMGQIPASKPYADPRVEELKRLYEFARAAMVTAHGVELQAKLSHIQIQKLYGEIKGSLFSLGGVHEFECGSCHTTLKDEGVCDECEVARGESLEER